MLFGGMHRLQEHAIIQTHNKSYSLTAEIEVPESGANGVIVSMGAGIGGWSLYAKDGKLKHCYNFFGIENYFAEGKQEIPAGKHQVRMEFTYDGGGLAKGGSVALYVDGKKDGEGRVDMTVPMLFGTDTCDVGKDAGSAVSPDYGPKDNQFSGTVNWVQIDIDEAAEDLDHLITPEERYKVAMARQ
jgi:arylsulfatase